MPTCKQCGSSDTYEDATTGQLACDSCGYVLDEIAISTDIDFHEGGNGARGIIGTIVHHGSGHRSGDRYSYRDSRALTLSNSRRQIKDMAATLHMTDDHVESAQHYYKLALERNFTQGRPQSQVVAACLYLVCRTEKTPHILLDFCDAIQPPVNVYVLGATYLKLCKSLNLATKSLPVIDPSIYIHKYAAQLEFGDQVNKVGETANRIVQRMCRDWIQTGRRPTGLVAAALLLAARYHNFSRTVREVVDVVRVCDVTLRKRLGEFGNTGSGALTLNEFLAIELEEECDPPAFTRGRLTAQDRLMLEESGMSPTDITEQMREVMESHDFALASSCTQLVPVNRKRPGRAVDLSEEEDDPDRLSDVDDDEIKFAILDQHEVDLRTELWTELNREYLEQQEEKRRLEEENAANGITAPKRKRRRKTALNASSRKAAHTNTLEAVQQLLVEKKLSKKINYDALQGLDDAPPAETVEKPTTTTSGDLSSSHPRTTPQVGSVKSKPADEEEDDEEDDYLSDIAEPKAPAQDYDDEDEEATLRQIQEEYVEDYDE